MIKTVAKGKKDSLQIKRFALQIISLCLFIALGISYKKIAFFITIPLMIFLGPVFCGWLCPFGAIQRIAGKIGKKLFGKRYNSFISKKQHSTFKYTRYLVAIVGIGVVILAKIGIMDKMLSDEITHALEIIAYIAIALSLTTKNFYCKYFCKDGAIYSIFNVFRPKKIRRNTSSCVSCKKCDNVCPMGIDISNKEVVKDIYCISCFQCTSKCPKEGTLTIKNKSKVL